MEDTLKLTITITPYESWVADLLTAEIADLGFDTFVETPEGFDAFVARKNYGKTKTEELLQKMNSGEHMPRRLCPGVSEQETGDVPDGIVFPDDSAARSFNERFRVEWKEEIIPSQNWNDVWEKNYFQPLVISDQVVVRAPFHTGVPACPIEIVIDPQMAFGTGNHETTSLMMEIILASDIKGRKVLDMGCGTGILAILAAKLGASAIAAIDMDPWSFRAVSENILLNHTPNVTPTLGDAALLNKEKYDLILANIQKNVILNDIHMYASVLLPGGELITSGFFLTDLSDIQRMAQESGLVLKGFREKNNWVAAIFGQPQ